MTRPTVSISGQITANTTTQTPPANARGMFVFIIGQAATETTGFTHTMTGCSFGGVALTGPTQAGPANSAHMDGFYLSNYASFTGRASDSLVFTGGTMSTVQTHYRGYVAWIIHSTHTVTMPSILANAAETTAGNTLSVSPTPGSGVEALSVIGWCDALASTVTALAGQTSLLANVAILTKEVSASWENVTGTHAVGYTVNTTSGFNRCAVVASTWVEGTLVATQTGAPRIFIFG